MSHGWNETDFVLLAGVSEVFITGGLRGATAQEKADAL